MPGPWALQLSGAVCCSALMLALAGAAKIWRGAPDSAIRRALRIRPARWRLVEYGAGALECATGAAMCTGAAALVAGSVMAALGAMFAGLLVLARRRGTPGGCGCLPWRTTADRITGRAIARAGCIIAAGVADLSTAPPGIQAAGHAWFGVGAVTAALAYTLLSGPVPVRTPRCHRRAWLPARDALRTVRRSPAFTAFAESHGPITGAPRHKRHGCTDEFSFPTGPADLPEELVFAVSRGPGGIVAVRASASIRNPSGRAAVKSDVP